MVTEQELGWLAGLFDGEGSILFKDKKTGQLRLQISNADRDLLQRAQRILDDLEIDSSVVPASKGQKPVFRLAVEYRNGIERFFSKVPVQSANRLARWAELKTISPYSRAKEHTKARRGRLARTHPSLL